MANHHHRYRKSVKNTRKISIGSILIILSIIIFFSGLAYYYISNDEQQGTTTTIHQVTNDKFDDDVDVVDDLVVNKSETVVSLAHELKVYEKEFKDSLRNVGQSMQDDFDDNVDDEYDGDDDDDNGGDAIDSQDMGRSEMENNTDSGHNNAEVLTNVVNNKSSLVSSDVKTRPKRGNISRKKPAKKLDSEKGLDSGKPVKVHNKGSSCEMKFMNSTAQLVEPPESTKFSRFTLQYTDVEERPSESEQWQPRFSGHQSLEEREESFYARNQRINCGFIKGPEGSQSTGFDLEEADFRYMSRCHIAVSSCIFGNSDYLRSPFGKTVTRLSRKNVCFVMFVDEITSQTLASEDHKPDELGFIGFWKIVVIKNLPFDDLRRVGKIPKFLAHRLFPSARYSIWLDSKLRLQSDPLLILEYFLWRKDYEYAISNHYRRHCVWEEVAQNKKLNKFNHTILDQQFFFYQADGLKRFNASDPNKLLPSNVPEGSFILRAHTPMSNLFSCLWFNEVDRFTPRDQLSFAYVYHKLRRMNPEKPFYFNMFKDCERRTIAKLFRHRSEQKQKVPADTRK